MRTTNFKMVTCRRGIFSSLSIFVLLLGVTTTANAFVQHAPQLSRSTTKQFRSPISIQINNQFPITSSNSIDFESQVPKLFDETQKKNLATEFPSKESLPWIGMFVLFLHAQFFGASPAGVIPTELANKNVAFSAVSATLLRQSSSKGRSKRKFLIAGALIAWQLSQYVNIQSAIATGVPKFTAWYMACVTKYPLLTKSLTSGVIGAFGDTVAQTHEERIRAKKTESRFSVRNYDRRRGLSVILDGIFVTGPLLHFVYEVLEGLFPVVGTGLAASAAAITQVLIDDIFVDAFSVAIMFFTTGFGEGYSVKQIVPQFKKDYFKTLKTSWATSVLVMPLEFCLFRFFPLSLRVLGMDFIDIIWAAMVSYRVHHRRKPAEEELIPAVV